MLSRADRRKMVSPTQADDSSLKSVTDVSRILK